MSSNSPVLRRSQRLRRVVSSSFSLDSRTGNVVDSSRSDPEARQDNTIPTLEQIRLLYQEMNSPPFEDSEDDYILEEIPQPRKRKASKSLPGSKTPKRTCSGWVETPRDASIVTSALVTGNIQTLRSTSLWVAKLMVTGVQSTEAKQICEENKPTFEDTMSYLGPGVCKTLP